jgi:hypothetical protein
VIRYTWKQGIRYSAKAQAVGDRLEELQAANGQRLTPRVVVDDARDPQSPLHPCFEWDDLRAAELHREQQARRVLSAIRVVVTPKTENTPAQIVRAYVHLVEHIGIVRQPVYVPIAQVQDNTDLYRAALREARAQLVALQRHYADIRAIADLLAEPIEELDALAGDVESVNGEATA